MIKDIVENSIRNYARGFNINKFWRLFTAAKKASHKALKEFYTILYMRYATKCGGYIGRETTIEDKPLMPHGFHGVHISRTSIIGKNAIIYQNVTIADGKHPTIIGDHVMIGAGAIIIDATIGNNVKIGAGAIVTGVIPDNSTVVSPKGTITQHEDI